MFTKKEVQNFRNRIRKARASFSIGTDMFLTYDIDAMPHEKRVNLQKLLLDSSKPLSYDYLDKVINKQLEVKL